MKEIVNEGVVAQIMIGGETISIIDKILENLYIIMDLVIVMILI